MARGTKNLSARHIGSSMLRSTKFEQYFELIWKSLPEERRNLFTHLDGLWFNLYFNGAKEKVKLWIRSTDIFEKTYVIVPIVMWGHWTILILCHFNEDESGKNNRSMILLDSLQSAQHNLKPNIRRFVLEQMKLFKKARKLADISEIPLLVPKVPQQIGGEECGYYGLLYAKLFMESAPNRFCVQSGYPYFMRPDWFSLNQFSEFQSSFLQLPISSSSVEHPVCCIPTEISGTLSVQEEATLLGITVPEDENEGNNGDFEKDDDSNGSKFSDSDYELSDEEDFQIFELVADQGLEDFDENISEEVRKQEKQSLKKSKTNDDKEQEPGCLEICVGEEHVETNPVNIVEDAIADNRVEDDKMTENVAVETVMKKRGGQFGPRMTYLWQSNTEHNFTIGKAKLQDSNAESGSTDDSDAAYFKHDGYASDTDGDDSQHYPKFRTSRDMDDPQFSEGMLFNTKGDFKAAIINHSVKRGKKLHFQKDDKERCKAICESKNCSWYVYAHQVGKTPTFQIRSIQPNHSCSRSTKVKFASATVLARKYLDDFKSEQGINVVEFQQKIHRELNLDVTINKVCKIKKIAKDIIEGSYKDQYKLLYDYCEEIRRSNPGSTIYMDAPEDEETGLRVFRRIYCCLDTLRKGFKAGCRKVLGLDGTFLKGPHPGVLLTAVGIDANNGIFPVAYAICENESKATWTWFIGALIEDLEIYEPANWTLISDRQKELIPAVGDLIQGVEHGHCVRHLHNNFKSNHPGQALKEMLWKCAKSTYKNRFEEQMQKLKKFDESAHEWLLKNTNAKYWTRSHFEVKTKCDVLLNNHNETFNRQILRARKQPILGILERIRVYLMLRNQSRRSWIRRTKGAICLRIVKRLDKLKEEAAFCYPSFAGLQKYEVREHCMDQFSVDLKEKTCTCRKWDLCGIPCKHAIAALGVEGLNAEDFVHSCYSTEAYLRAYEPVICPCNGPNNWPKTGIPPVQPPPKIKLPGRPKMKRRLEPGEMSSKVSKNGVRKLSKKGVKMTCRVCGNGGHNARCCPQKDKLKKTSQHDEHCEENDYGHNLNNYSRCGGSGHNVRSCGTHMKTDGLETVSQQQDYCNTQESTMTEVQNMANQCVASSSSQATQQKSKKRKPVQCSRCSQTGHNRARCTMG